MSQRSGGIFDFSILSFDRNLVNAGYIKCRYALIGDTKGLLPLHLVHDFDKFDDRTGGGNPIQFYEITNLRKARIARETWNTCRILQRSAKPHIPINLDIMIQSDMSQNPYSL